jgi:hypothetical protein
MRTRTYFPTAVGTNIDHMIELEQIWRNRMSQTISWGIIGTGRIAGIFADGLAKVEDRQASCRCEPYAGVCEALWRDLGCVSSLRQL